ncbi:amidohydrolase [Fusibacter paucivorans]|uniref:Amidohydrolase n=1 Tax=Fusibacter paucivorans TaxID=76009 RepID=A0ABS5PRN6_9FIRM|nr:amidohydrolase [Fusibacter paucivorans]MBS7527819.1 amidohydrolase [Fusibacter paucivorans]
MSFSVVEIYNQLHKMPETGFELSKTSRFISDTLTELGYEVIDNVGQCGLVGILDSGVPGPVLGFRADMDALAYEIDGKTVNRHTCGHDANCAIALGAACIIKERGISKGKMMFIFQPAEEKGTGAMAMIQSGRLPAMTELFGMHLRDYTELSLGEALPGLNHSGACMMRVVIHGVSSHGARPHLGVSAVDAAMLAGMAVNAVRVDPTVAHSAKVTGIRSHGTAFNIIPDTVDMNIDLRGQTNEVLDTLIERVKTAIEGAVGSIGATAEIDILGHIYAANLDQPMVEEAAAAIESVLGVCQPPAVTPGSDDFHFFKRHLDIQNTFIGLGADLKPGLHHPEMTFDLKALEIGRDIVVAFIQRRLG